MQPRVSLELKVGALIVSGVLILLFLLFVIGDVSTYFQPGYRLRIMFDSANGIGTGAPVHYAGVEVGKVEHVELVYLGDVPKVELIVRLPRSVEVRSDDAAAISTFGLLGEKYLAITPGPRLGKLLEPHAILLGRPPVSTEQVIERSNQVLTEFQQTLQGLNSLVGDPEARIYFKETLQEARDATRNWKLLGQRLNVALSYAESGQGSVGKLLFDEELYNRMLAFVDDLREHPWKLLIHPKEKRKVPSSSEPPGS